MPVTLRSAASSLLWFIKNAFLLIPVYMVVILIASDWYMFVVQWGAQQHHAFPAGAYLLCVIFTCVVGMILWSYYRTIFTSSSVCDNPPPSDYFTRVRELFPNQPDRVCLKCNGPKPLRTHHCSVCGKCILKMDHHCPWVATCVGFKNYKYFCLFVMWGCVGCTLYLVAGIELILNMFASGKTVAPGITSLMTSLLTGAFAIALLFFSAFHVHLVITGQSTIEASLSKRNARRAAEAAAAGADAAASQSLTHNNGSNHADDVEAQRGVGVSSGSGGAIAAVGSVAAAVATLSVGQPAHAHPIPHGPVSFSAATRRENWDAVFGANPWLWFVPVDTLEDTGYEFDFLFEDDGDDNGGGGGHHGDIESSHSSSQEQQHSYSQSQQLHAGSSMAALAAGLQTHVAQHVAVSVDDSDEAQIRRDSRSEHEPSYSYSQSWSRSLEPQQEHQQRSVNAGAELASPSAAHVRQYPDNEEQTTRASLVHAE